jgi:hypothetical protein
LVSVAKVIDFGVFSVDHPVIVHIDE